MNGDVRACSRSRAASTNQIFGARKDDASRTAFLDFRSELARRMQEEWLAVLETARGQKPHLDLVLTHVDDRLDTACAKPSVRTPPGATMLDTHTFTFLIETLLQCGTSARSATKVSPSATAR